MVTKKRTQNIVPCESITQIIIVPYAKQEF